MKQKSSILQILLLSLLCSCYGTAMRLQPKRTLAYVELPKYRFDSKPHGEVLTYPPEEELKELLATKDSDTYFKKLFASKHFHNKKVYIENVKIYEDFTHIYIVQVP
ncbi:MAG: hypothetical protein AAF518_17600 [Spirochaetota bacterium]